MTEIEARVLDLINFSSNQKPVEFEDAFKSIIQDRVTAAIENKKIEIASSMFNTKAQEDEQEYEADDEDLDNEQEEIEDLDDDGETA